ncbi:unnamed protein product [Rotaria magnacalcarata]|uniref:RNF34/RFFL HeH domain-containing protein n=1 Tax=Rotaria magnacalcarata TaxID=392030 RepID=A0A8S3HY12_9BILA|nr:unnamed protein product [Rotaria magnacalcarata]
MTLNDISTLESIDDLTAQQLQQILVHNYGSIAGCVEKSELISKVKLLYHDEKQKKESNAKISKEDPNENLCKVCLAANIDCVVLNCGHLCTCIRYGEQLSNCPICRCAITSVVRVFKS